MMPDRDQVIAAERIVLHKTNLPQVDMMTFGRSDQASLAALFTGAVAGGGEVAGIAAGALEQLHLDLRILREVLSSGAELNNEIVGGFIRGMECRAWAASEMVARIEAANAPPRPVTLIPDIGSVQEGVSG